jgi:hypothetical protein
MLLCVRAWACCECIHSYHPGALVAYTGRTRKPPLAGAFLWLRGKDSNLDYLIQSYLPSVTACIALLTGAAGMQGFSGVRSARRALAFGSVPRRWFAIRLQTQRLRGFRDGRRPSGPG